MASPDRTVRVRTVVAQSAMLVVVGVLVSQSLLATQIAATVLAVTLAFAFIMHLTASALTRPDPP